MRRAVNTVVAILAVVLLAAPAVQACCDVGATSPPCEMGAEKGSARGSMHGSTHGAGAAMAKASPCHTGDRMSSDCCDLGPAPEPIPTRLTEVERLFATAELRQPLVVTPPEPVDPTARSSPPRSDRLHDLGRYTLYSAFLL